MTVTNPRGDPSLLETVLRTEHERLLGLATEAAKDIPTPGVREQLLAQLRADVPAHVRVEVAVIGPELLDAGMGGDDIDGDRAALRDALGRADHHTDALVQALRAHAVTCDDVVARLHSALGGERMAALGWQYTRAAEVGDAVPPSATDPDELFGPSVSALRTRGTRPSERAQAGGGEHGQV